MLSEMKSLTAGKNIIVCPKCGKENPFYNTVCSECKTYLRNKVYNIDLFSTSASLVDNPIGAFRSIVFAEHKNFVFFLIIIIALKYLINARFLSLLTVGEFNSTIGLLVSYLIVLSATLIFYFLYVAALKTFGQLNELEIRIKDAFAVIIYSQIPFVFAIVILFPLELIIFGDYLFSLNPSPFIIKEAVAYVFLAIECIVFLWSIFLSFWAFYVISGNIIFSLINTTIFNLFLAALIILCSVFVFRL